MEVIGITLSELKDYLLDLVSERFSMDSVVWAEQYMTQYPLPQITLKLKDITMPQHPVNITRDGNVSAYYECTKILEINRYANSVSGEAGEITTLDNPSVNDLTLFLLFLQSEAGIERAYASNVCIEGMGQVRDLSELDRTHYRYRAMQEYTVRFILEYENGKATIHNPFEGEELEPVKEPAGYFEDLEEMEDTYE